MGTLPPECSSADQRSDDTGRPDKGLTYAYQSKENPGTGRTGTFDGYWQQDVDYTINARLDDQNRHR